jgi:hypothetical protein
VQLLVKFILPIYKEVSLASTSVGFGVMFRPEHAWLGRVPFSIKKSTFLFTLVCCMLFELFGSCGLSSSASLGVAEQLICHIRRGFLSPNYSFARELAGLRGWIGIWR